MEQKGKKKEWVAPELLVLARSHPEEAVLTNCKGLVSGAPGGQYAFCATNVPSFCSFCDSLAMS